MNENNLIVKSNAIVEGKMKLTALEHKMIAILASEIKADDDDIKKYEFSISEFIKLTGTQEKNAYAQIHDAAEKLIKKTITYRKNNSTVTTSLLSSAETIDGEGMVILELSSNIKDEFLKLKELFTKYRLAYVLKLKGTPAIRIYELLKQYQKAGERVLKVDEIKELLGLDKDSYRRFYDFEKNVLKAAQKEINEKTDITISYKKIKKGRRIDKIKFDIVAKFFDEEDIHKNYEDEGVFDYKGFKDRVGMGDEKLSRKQIIELYELACNEMMSIGGEPETYMKKTYYYSVKKKRPKHLFSYLKKALANNYIKYRPEKSEETEEGQEQNEEKTEEQMGLDELKLLRSQLEAREKSGK